jgi:hypothetical protein
LHHLNRQKRNLDPGADNRYVMAQCQHGVHWIRQKTNQAGAALTCWQFEEALEVVEPAG